MKMHSSKEQAGKTIFILVTTSTKYVKGSFRDFNPHLCFNPQFCMIKINKVKLEKRNKIWLPCFHGQVEKMCVFWGKSNYDIVERFQSTCLF